MQQGRVLSRPVREDNAGFADFLALAEQGGGIGASASSVTGAAVVGQRLRQGSYRQPDQIGDFGQILRRAVSGAQDAVANVGGVGNGALRFVKLSCHG